MKKVRVVYTVKFECDVEADGDSEDELNDAIRDIDIPEGGKNDSVYCENSFDVIEVYDPSKDE